MKLVRYSRGKTACYGILETGCIAELAAGPFSCGWKEEEPRVTGARFALDEVKLLPPCEPTKYIGVGLNYFAAAKAMDRPPPEVPLTFLKPPSAVIGQGETILLPPGCSDRVIFEGELAAVIGRTARFVPQEKALSYILGYTCTNDVTDAGQLERAGGHTLLLKCPDTFAPLGPCIETELDPQDVCIESRVNDVLRQSGSTKDMIFSAAYLVYYLSSIVTLVPGDVIALGTPSESPRIREGDEVEITIPSIGTLKNNVALAPRIGGTL